MTRPRSMVELWTASGHADIGSVHSFVKALLPDSLMFLATATTWRAAHTATVAADVIDDSVFDARWFSPDGEIRWRRHHERSRVAALITNGELVDQIGHTLFANLTAVGEFQMLQRRYRCWPIVEAVPGERTVVVHAARLAPIELPLRRPIPPGGAARVTVTARELVADVGDGNQRVVHELLTDIVAEVHTTSQEESDD